MNGGTETPDAAPAVTDMSAALVALGTEHARLRLQLSSVRTRVHSAEERLAAQVADARTQLTEVVAAAAAAVRRLDDEHGRAVESIRTAARRDAAAILAGARRAPDATAPPPAGEEQ